MQIHAYIFFPESCFLPDLSKKLIYSPPLGGRIRPEYWRVDDDDDDDDDDDGDDDSDAAADDDGNDDDDHHYHRQHHQS